MGLHSIAKPSPRPSPKGRGSLRANSWCAVTSRYPGVIELSVELTAKSAVELAMLIRARAVSPVEIVEAHLRRIESINPSLNAIVTLAEDTIDRARAADIALSKGETTGPLHGVPLTVKDTIDTQGLRTTSGSRILAHHVPERDASVVARLKAAGAIILGKTNTPELGLNITTEPEAYGASCNPWNPGHSTGGSSGGSAAAVAAGLVPIAHANDGGGSIRIPASECGLVGLKPSRGRVSLGPDFAEMWHGFAIEGVLTRSVRDTAVVLDAIAGNMPGDPYSAPPQSRPFRDELAHRPQKLKIGLMRRAPRDGAPLHPDCRAAVEDAAGLLESLGHRVEECEI